MNLKPHLRNLTTVRRVELLALPLLAATAGFLWTAPLRAERALQRASFDELRAVSKRQPDNPRVFYFLGIRLRDLGQLGPATAAFARAAELDPSDEDTCLAWGSAAAAFGREQEAFDALTRCAKAHPQSKRAHLALAVFCQEHFALQRANEEATAAASCDPADAGAWRLLGVTALELQDLRGAETALEKAARLAPVDWRAQMGLGQVLTALHRPNDAVLRYRIAARLAPREPAVTLALGQAELNTAKAARDIDSARTTLAAACEQNPASGDALLALGRSFVRLRRWPEAKGALERAEKLNGRDSATHFELARLYRRLGDAAAADRESRAHAAINQYEEAKLSLGSRARTSGDPALRLKLARLCAAHGDYGAATLEYRRLAAQGVAPPEAARELALLDRNHPQLQPVGASAVPAALSPAPITPVALLLRDADSVLQRERFAAAEAAYVQIIQADPKCARGYQGLGLALAGQGKTETAFRALESALKLDGRLPEAQYALARLYFDQGFIDEASRRLERLTRQVSDNPEYLHALAVCLLDDSSRYAETEQILQRAIKLDPKRPAYWRDLARTQENLNRIDDAESSYRNALALEPEQAQAQVNLADFLIDHRPTRARLKEADALLGRAVAREANSAEAHLGLGRVALERSNVHVAVDELQRAVAGDPNLAPAWYHLARAYDRSGDVVRAKDCRSAFHDITTYRKDLSETEEQARYNLRNPNLRIKLARLYSRGGQYARAINQYQVCLSLDRHNTSARRELVALTTRLQSRGQMPSMSALNGMLVASVKAP